MFSAVEENFLHFIFCSKHLTLKFWFLCPVFYEYIPSWTIVFALCTCVRYFMHSYGFIDSVTIYSSTSSSYIYISEAGKVYARDNRLKVTYEISKKIIKFKWVFNFEHINIRCISIYIISPLNVHRLLVQKILYSHTR